MPEPTTLLPEIEAPPVAPAIEGSRRLRLMGLGVVLSVSLTHFVIGAVYSLFRVQNASQRYHSQIGVFDAVAAELISLLLLWFVLSANKLRWADIGWRAQGIDLLHGAGLIIGSRAAAVIAALTSRFLSAFSSR